jgi:antitoxin component of MazEF toxin-antitoxin module
MNTARTSDNSSAISVPAMLRKLRDANRSDELLVRCCNDLILMIRNLQKIEQRQFNIQGDEPAAKHLRENLANGMRWLAKWAQDRAINS